MLGIAIGVGCMISVLGISIGTLASRIDRLEARVQELERARYPVLLPRRR